MRSLTLVTPDDLALAEEELRDAIDREQTRQFEEDLTASIRQENDPPHAPASAHAVWKDVENPAFLLRAKGEPSLPPPRRVRALAAGPRFWASLAAYLPFVALAAAAALAPALLGNGHAGSAWLLAPVAGALCASLAAPRPRRPSALGKLAATQVAVSGAALSGLFTVSVEPSGFLAVAAAVLAVSMAVAAELLQPMREG